MTTTSLCANTPSASKWPTLIRSTLSSKKRGKHGPKQRERERERKECVRESVCVRERERGTAKKLFFSVMMDWKVADVRLAKKF